MKEKIKYAIGTAKEQAGAIESRPGGGLQILFEKFDDGWFGTQDRCYGKKKI